MAAGLHTEHPDREDHWIPLSDLMAALMMVFLLIALFADFPRAPFFRIIKIVAVPACLLAMTVVMPGMMSNRYDAVLSRSGIEFGTFSGKRPFRWSDIQAFYVLREITGKRVCIQLNEQAASPESGRVGLKSLPDNYGMDADELAKTLLRWHRQHAAVGNS